MEGVLAIASGVNTEFGSKAASRGGIGRVTKLVKPFWPIQEANTESISIKHSRYSERRIEKGMEAIIENLMKEPEGTWVSRVTLKQRSRSSVGDTGLLNFSLRCVENRRVGDSMVVRRSIHPVSQVMAYRLERIDSDSQEHPPVCEERRALDPHPPKTSGRGSEPHPSNGSQPYPPRGSEPYPPRGSEPYPPRESDTSGGQSRKEKGGKPKPRTKKEVSLVEERNMSKEETEEAGFEEGLSTLFALGGDIRPLPAMVDGQAVNLLLLYQHVACNGGYEEVSKRREWNVVAAQMGLKLEAGPCLKLLHFKYLHHLEALLGDLSPPSQAPKGAHVPWQGPAVRQRTRSSSTCTSERNDESDRSSGRNERNEERTTLPSLQAVSEGSLGQHAESRRCTETEATSSACSLKLEESLKGFKDDREAMSKDLDEVFEGLAEDGGKEEAFGGFKGGISEGFKGDVSGAFKEEVSGGLKREASKGEAGSIDLGPETSIEGSLLTDALPSARSVGEKRSLTESDIFGSFAEPPAVRKSGVYVSGSFSEVSGTADVAGAQKRAWLEGCAELSVAEAGTNRPAAVPTARDQDGGANLLEDESTQPVGKPQCKLPALLETGEGPVGGSPFRGFGGLQALTLRIQGLDSLGPQDASGLWLGEARRKEPHQGKVVLEKPNTLSPQRLKLILNPSPRKVHTLNPSPRNLTLSPSKWMQSLSGQKRKAGVLCETQIGVNDATNQGFGQGLGPAETPEQRRSREAATGHPLRRPRCYQPLTSFAKPPSSQLTAVLTTLREQLVRHRESIAWQEGLVVRLRNGVELPLEGRRTRKKQVEEEPDYLQPRIGPKYQAHVPDWNPLDVPKRGGVIERQLGGSDDDTLMSELEWVSRPVWPWSSGVAETGFRADPGFSGPGKRPVLKRLSSQTDSATVRKNLVSEARSTLDFALGAAGGDLGLLDMGERVAKKWTRGQEQRFLSTASSIPRGEEMGEEFYGEGFFRALGGALPEKSLGELVNYYYNVYKVRCKRQDGSSRWAVEKVAPEGGSAASHGGVQITGTDRDQGSDAGLRGIVSECRRAQVKVSLYVESRVS